MVKLSHNGLQIASMNDKCGHIDQMGGFLIHAFSLHTVEMLHHPVLLWHIWVTHKHIRWHSSQPEPLPSKSTVISSGQSLGQLITFSDQIYQSLCILLAHTPSFLFVVTTKAIKSTVFMSDSFTLFVDTLYGILGRILSYDRHHSWLHIALFLHSLSASLSVLQTFEVLLTLSVAVNLTLLKAGLYRRQLRVGWRQSNQGRKGVQISYICIN